MDAYMAVFKVFMEHSSYVHWWVVDRVLENGALATEDLHAVEALRNLLLVASDLDRGPVRMGDMFLSMFEEVRKDLAVIDWALERARTETST